MPRGKVITALRDRPQIEAALQALARARTEEEGEPYLQELARWGAAVLPVVVSHLDTPDPWMVRALGRVLSRLQDRPRAREALRRAVLAPDSSDRRRIVAMVLLDQFLGQPPDEALFAALGNPTEVALRALLSEPAPERAVRLDYLSILHTQPPKEILAAVERLRQAASDGAVEALRFLAMDGREQIAQAALKALGTIRRPAAMWALRVLLPNVPSFRQAQVERALRKLVFSGVPDVPLPEPPSGSRVLASPLDGGGNQLLLFLFPQEEGYRVLHVLVDDVQGVRGTYEATYGRSEIAAPAAVGTVQRAPHPWEGPMLETTWGYAQELLSAALPYNEAHGGGCPLEYRFYSDLVWGWTVPPDEGLPAPRRVRQLRPSAAARLLTSPYLASWFLESAAVYGVAEAVLAGDPTGAELQLLLSLGGWTLLESEFPPEVCLRYARRLRLLAGWLLRAGERELAGLALAAEKEMAAAKPLESAFAQVMLQRGLLVAASSLRQKMT